MYQPVAPAKPKRRALKMTGLGCGGLAGLFILLVVIVGVSQEDGKPAPTASASPAPAAAPLTVGHTSASPTPQANRDAAALVLHASVDHYRRELQQGQAIIGNTQYTDPMAGLSAFNDPKSAASRFRDYRQNPDPERDLSSQDAFKKADSYFTADNEPRAISDWQSDMGDAFTALTHWVSTAVDFQIAKKTRAELDGDAAKVDQALGKADADADALRKG